MIGGFLLIEECVCVLIARKSSAKRRRRRERFFVSVRYFQVWHLICIVLRTLDVRYLNNKLLISVERYKNMSHTSFTRCFQKANSSIHLNSITFNFIVDTNLAVAKTAIRMNRSEKDRFVSFMILDHVDGAAGREMPGFMVRLE